MDKKRVFNGFIFALLVLSIFELISGLILVPQYRADVSGAYASSKAMQSSGLHVVQSLHLWISASLIGGITLVVLYGLFSGVYRHHPKRLWVASVFLLLCAVLLQLTGHLLPWDRHAVQTAVIETGIAQSAPVLGATQANLLRGGSQVGPSTLTLWFWAHVAVLTALWLLMGILSLRRIRITGYSPKVALGVFVVLGAASTLLALTAPAHLGSAASSIDYTSYGAKPEWYILPLHGLLDAFQRLGPGYGFLGTMVIPAVLVLLILATPWIERNRGAGKKSIAGPVLATILVLGGGFLIVKNAGDVAVPNGPNELGTSSVERTQAVLDPKLVEEGRTLFSKEACSSCHTLAGAEGQGGPPLDGEGTKRPDVDWQARHLANPKSVNPGSVMPAYGTLEQHKIQALAQFLVSLH